MQEAITLVQSSNVFLGDFQVRFENRPLGVKNYIKRRPCLLTSGYNFSTNFLKPSQNDCLNNFQISLNYGHIVSKIGH